MSFTSILFSRQKEKIDAETQPLHNDPEKASITPNVPVQSSSSNNDKKEKKNNRFMLALGVVALVLTVAIVSAPSHIKKRRMKLLNRQFQKTLDIIRGHKKNVLDKVEELITTEEHLKLMQLDKQIKLLQDDVLKKENKIEKLTNDVDIVTYNINDLTTKIDKFNNEANRFCGGCIINMGGSMNNQEITCNERLNFVIKNYGNKEKVIDLKLGVMKNHPSCTKKIRIRYDTSDFCSDCFFIEKNDDPDMELDKEQQQEQEPQQKEIKVSCNERLKAVVKKYGYESDPNEVEDALMKEYNECSYLCNDCETLIMQDGKKKFKTTCGKRIIWKKHGVSDEDKESDSHIGFKADFMKKHPECKKQIRKEKKWKNKL